MLSGHLSTGILTERSQPASVKFSMQLGTVPIPWQGSRKQGIMSHSTTIHNCFHKDVSSMKKEKLAIKAEGTHQQRRSLCLKISFAMKVHNTLMNLKRPLDFKYFLFFLSL